MSAVVITPTTGAKTLEKAIQSVAGSGAEHWVVVDGAHHAEKVIEIIKANQHPDLRLVILPENTGKPQRFYDKSIGLSFWGHRIYTALPFLVNTDYVFFLDEDNWYEPNHIPLMTQTMNDYKVDWAYSLRKVVDENGDFFCEDNCDSLGVFPNHVNLAFVDMNCYCFTTRFLTKICTTLYSSEYIADQNLFKKAISESKNFVGTGYYTVNYRITDGVKAQWFLVGNQKMNEIYKKFPWRAE